MFATLNVDANIQVGLPWARQATARVAWHPTKEFAIGVGVENPDQYVGTGEVVFPFAFNAQLGGQFDAANNAGTPNKYPDLVGKAAYDTDIMDRHVHSETAAVGRTFAAAGFPQGIAGATFENKTVYGWGVQGSANVEVFKGFNVLGTFWSDGGGRYLFGLGPTSSRCPRSFRRLRLPALDRQIARASVRLRMAGDQNTILWRATTARLSSKTTPSWT